MRIKKLSFKNKKTSWNVVDVKFDALTLLVGASGVGKTQILNALDRLSRIVRGESYNGMEWNVEFTIDSIPYEWSGSFEVVDVEEEMYLTKEFLYDIVWEKLRKGNQIIIERDVERILYNGQETLKLDNQKSAINLLKQEDAIEPIYNSFTRLYKLNTESRGINISPLMQDQSKILTIDDIRQLPANNIIDKLFLLKKNNLPEFEYICNSFYDIFPSVDEIDFTIGQFFNERTFPILQIKERKTDVWILQSEISSGMYRSLAMLVTLYLAVDGDVILVDEFENGLGVNCINQIADNFISPVNDIQIVMTSHHPYIINAIPYRSWKIVVRNTNTVQTYSAAELKIGEHSKHDAFMQLIQTSANQNGVL